MSDEMNVKISDIKASFIRKEAKLVDKYSGNGDGKISKEEGAKLASILNGELEKKSNQKKLAKESDEVKAIFGLNVSTPIERTQPEAIKQIDESSNLSSNKTLIDAAIAQAKADDTEKASEESSKTTLRTPFEEVKARFKEIRGYDEKNNTTNGVTAYKAYRQVKKEFKGKGKEYNKAIDQLHDWAKHDFADARAQKTRAQVQAYDSEGRIINEENLKYNTSKKVYKREKELIKANNNGVKDRWEKRALRNKNTSFVKKSLRYVSGLDSDGKIDDKAVASGNKAAYIREYKSFTKEELQKALGEKNPLLQPYTDSKGKTYENVLVATGLITEENGKYRVKELSKVVNSGVSYTDNTLNDHDNHNESEIQAVLTKLYQSLRANGSGEFKTSELTDSQVRDLVDFLGLGDDKSRLLAKRLWQNMWKGAGIGAVLGGAAGAVNGKPTNININAHQEVNLSLENFTDAQRSDFINGLLSENEFSGVPVETDYGNGVVRTTLSELKESAVGIHILQDAMVDMKLVRMLKSVTYGTLTGAGGGALAGALSTIGSHAREKEVLGMVFDCDSTYEEIIDSIDNAYSDKHLSPQMKEALKKIAELGIVKEKDPKTGVWKAVLDKDCKVQWSYCQFIEAYNNARGNQILNAAEGRAAARTVEANRPDVPECEPAKQEEKVEKKEQPKQSCDVTSRPDINFKDSNKYGWHEIIQMFYSDCLAKHTEKEIRYALRKANNIPNTLPYVPANLLLPYQLFEGEDECTRTTQKDVKKGKYNVKIVKTSVKTPNGQWQAGIVCTDKNGNKTTTWLPGKHNTQAEAEHAASEIIASEK